MATTADLKIPSKVFDVFDIKDKNAGTSTGKKWLDSHGETIETFSPTDGETIAHVTCANKDDYDKVIRQAQEAFKEWRKWPAPSRGHVIRAVGSKLRERKEDLGALVSYEMGKSLQEGKGEVQEMIDICDYATGLSKQLYGFTMHSERPDHRLYEQYHPLGVVGLITAFNFPVAVWAWNTMIALTCGDTVVWKPSDKTPLCARACQKIMGEVFEEFDVPEGVSNVVTGGACIGEQISHDDRIPLVSATGSIAMGKKVGQAVISRLGKPLLELGGNNGMIITPSADMDLTLNAALFGAVGTAGQRCTTTRRLIIHEDIYDEFKDKLVNAYKQLK
ncbi:MAG: aldehyde dehydrogenase family protein, partial [Bacteroidetes bacterium SW_11_45_7]